MTDERYKYCDHKTFGVGSAQLVKYRKDARDDLFMVTFQSMGQNQKWFMPRHYFISGETIFFIDDDLATVLYKEGRDNPRKKRTKTVRKEPKNLADILDRLK